jgi:two-component system sensor histidine kinase VicK
MVVHDLRNPIGAILGFSDLLMDDKSSLNSNQVEVVTEISKCGEALLKSVKDLLELSQFESGEYILRPERVSFAKLVQTVVSSLEVARNQRHITIDVDIQESLQVNVDQEYFREVLDNLFGNALRFTPVGGKIHLSATRQPGGSADKKEVVSIEITDTGGGIVPEAIPSLFDKNRITNVKLRKAGSRTGLGLVICHEIIAAHDGTLSITSTVGKGTTVTIALPV